MKLFFATVLIALSQSAFVQPALAQPAAPPATHVGSVVAERKPVTRESSYVGRVQAVNRVDIAARVTGFLEAALFTEGAMISEGTKLFQIEPGPFQAAVQQAEGEVLRAQA